MTLAQLPSGPDILLIETRFPAITPDMLFAYWTRPALLQQWWPQQAEIEAHVGGSYHLSWPQMNWHLRGRYISFQSGKLLSFTWRWDHDPQHIGEKEVKLIFELLTTNETRLLLTHRPYADTPEDQELRNEQHLVGWMYFLPRLQQLLEPTKKV